MEPELTASYRRCRALHRRYGRTYHLATRLLPAWKRPHVNALYGFARHADDIVDRTAETSTMERARLLREWSQLFFAGLHGEAVDDPVQPAVLHTIAVFRLDRADSWRSWAAWSATSRSPNTRTIRLYSPTWRVRRGRSAA